MSKAEHLHFLSALSHVRILSSEWYHLKEVVYNGVKDEQKAHKKTPCSNFEYLAHVVQLSNV